jgi:sugar phosphate isomerase/epimerase
LSIVHDSLSIAYRNGEVRMKLGMIALPKEESFISAQQKGLDFLEFCINTNHDADGFLGSIKGIRECMEEYGVVVQSIGRWKSERINRDGSLNEAELELSYRLIDAADFLGCSNFVCGCNYIEELSYYQNCTSAMEYLSKLLDYGKRKGVRISTYNCRKVNFIHSPMAWTIIHGHLKDLGIKYDPSHSRYAGADYLKEMAEWGDRFCHVHLKGSLIVDGQRFDDPPAGMDQTDWKSFLSILRAKNYTGGLSIEPHSPVWTGTMGEQGVEFTIRYMKEMLFRA